MGIKFQKLAFQLRNKLRGARILNILFEQGQHNEH